MRSPSKLAFFVAAMALAAGLAQAPLGAAETSEAAKAAAKTEVARESDGAPVLLIHYPWKFHRRPSVEVRMLEEKDGDEADVRPFRFVAEDMKGETTAAIYEARDRGTEQPHLRKLTKRVGTLDREYVVVGQKNRMDRAAVHVVFPANKEIENVPRAVFCLLESWAFDPQTLRLELPEAEFAGPAKLRVWFLREGNVVWQETVDWPGVKK